MTVEATGESVVPSDPNEIISEDPGEGSGAVVDPATSNPNPNGEPEDPEEPNPESVDLAKKFNTLTRHEKMLREKEEKLKTEEGEINSLRELRENLKNKPLEALKAAGLTFKDLAEMVLNDEKPTLEHQVKSLEERILADKKEREEREAREREESEKAAESAKTKKWEEAVSAAKTQIKELVDNNEEEYELIKHHGSHDLVWDVIQDVYNETKKVIPIAEAAAKVEEYLTGEAEKILQANKFKKRFQQIKEPEIDQEIEEDRTHNFYAQKMLEEKYGRGLSNDLTSEGSKPPQKSQPFLSDDESKERLAKKLQQRLEARGEM